jgi:hypothetical protein
MAEQEKKLMSVMIGKITFIKTPFLLQDILLRVIFSIKLFLCAFAAVLIPLAFT